MSMTELYCASCDHNFSRFYDGDKSIKCPRCGISHNVVSWKHPIAKTKAKK